MASNIVSPKGKTSVVWQHFGYPPGEADSKKATCKLCGVHVVHGGGMTNLKNHFRTWCRSTFDELFTENPGPSTGTCMLITTYILIYPQLHGNICVLWLHQCHLNNYSVLLAMLYPLNELHYYLKM